MASISPSKSPKKGRSDTAMSQVSSQARGKTPQAKSTPSKDTPIPVTQSFKALNDSSKLMAMAGPATTFMAFILDKQSRFFKSRFMTTSLEDKHEIHNAIEHCQVRKFRTLMEDNFNTLFPREKRVKTCIERMEQLVFDDSTHDLLILRENIMDAITNVNDIYESHPDSTTLTNLACDQIWEYFNKCLSKMSMLVMITVNRHISKKATVHDIDDTLLRADVELRRNSPSTYPPKGEIIRANTAKPERSKPPKVFCDACMTVF